VVLNVIEVDKEAAVWVGSRTDLDSSTIPDRDMKLNMRLTITNVMVECEKLHTILADGTSVVGIHVKVDVIHVALTIRTLPEANMDIGVTVDCKASVPSVVTSDELSLLFTVSCHQFTIGWSVEVSLDVEVVLKHRVLPSVTLTPTMD